MQVSLEKPSLNELKHFGILGMKWGVRKERDKGTAKSASAKPSYYDRSKADYIKRGFSEGDAEKLAKRKSTIRTAAFVAGGVTVAVGAAFVARHFYIENMDTKLKAGEKAFHIARGEIKDLEPGRGLFVTFDKADRLAYQWRLNNPNKIERIERTFEITKDIKIPSPKKSAALYNEFMSNPENKKIALEAFTKAGGRPHMGVVDHDSFITFGPYFSKGESWHKFASDNEAGENIWKAYKNFLVDKGYQGVLDANDRAKAHGFNVERPTIIFDAAATLKETARKSLGTEHNEFKTIIPTIREIGSTTTAAYVSAIAGLSAITVSNNSRAVESYRRVYPNNSKTNKEIINLMNRDQTVAYNVYMKVSKLK